VFDVQETIATGIHFSDYEQMKMNDKSLDEKLEERNEVRKRIQWYIVWILIQSEIY